jgi:hypothetical protein
MLPIRQGTARLAFDARCEFRRISASASRQELATRGNIEAMEGSAGPLTL